MRKLFLLFFILPFFSFSQVKISNIEKNQWYEILAAFETGDSLAMKSMKVKYPLFEIDGKTMVSVLSKVESSIDLQGMRAIGILVGSQINDIVSFKVPLAKMNEFLAYNGLTQIEIAKKIRPHLNKVIPDIRADSVHQGLNLPEKYTGKDVFIGVCDWGFDYTHPMYYDTAMGQSRIHAAWDQYKTSGPSPAGFSYGTEYSTIPTLLAAGSDTANIYSYAYHGGHVAGIAGGGGAGTPFRGVAFESQFLFATFLIDAGSVLDAYQWMYTKAQVAGKRLVINQSWGLHHIGNLDGTSLLSQAIDNYSAMGVVFVSSGGNNGDVDFHLEKQFSGDTLRSKVDFYPYSANTNMWGQSISAWGEPGNEFSLGIKVTNMSNGTLANSLFYSTSTTLLPINDSIVIGMDTILMVLEMESANTQNGRPHARFRIKSTNTAYKIILQATAASGTVHFWNVTELITDVGNWGMPFSISGIGTTAGNHNYSIGEPACTNSTIAVAAHLSSYYSGPNLLGGQIAGFSSFGPTLDGRVKPDISAPGVSVSSAVSHYTDNSYTPSVSVLFNSITYRFTRISGTSMSGPAVTGVVALLLDANPYLSSSQVKEIIKTTARTDANTGTIPLGGSLRWGAGKVNAYAAIKLALNTIDVTEVANLKYLVYPNPTQGILFIDGQLAGNEHFQVVDFQGKIVSEGFVINSTLSVENLETGAYILKISSLSKVHLLKFIVN